MIDHSQFSTAPGTYVLLVNIPGTITLQVGRKGRFDLPGGTYAYVGSAHGPGGLRARLSRHLRRDKTHHWHIDALTTQAPITTIWFTTEPERLECIWARALANLPSVTTPIPGFGSSDCACPSHLFALPPDTIPAAQRKLSEYALQVAVLDQ